MRNLGFRNLSPTEVIPELYKTRNLEASTQDVKEHSCGHDFQDIAWYMSAVYFKTPDTQSFFINFFKVHLLEVSPCICSATVAEVFSDCGGRSWSHTPWTFMAITGELCLTSPNQGLERLLRYCCAACSLDVGTQPSNAVHGEVAFGVVGYLECLWFFTQRWIHTGARDTPQWETQCLKEVCRAPGEDSTASNFFIALLVICSSPQFMFLPKLFFCHVVCRVLSTIVS